MNKTKLKGLNKSTIFCKGFTLIELLVVIGILAVILAIVLVAINPSRQFQQANDTQRRSDVNSILNAVAQYAADNRGSFPSGMPSAGNSSAVSTAGTGASFCNAIVPTYIAALPTDPTTGTTWTDCTSYSTGYTIARSSSGNRITVSATPEVAASISVTR